MTRPSVRSTARARSAGGASFLFALSAVLSAPVSAQHPPIDALEPAQPEIAEGVDYRVYDRDGNPSSIEAIVNASLGDDVLLIGEEHDDMIGHAFQTAIFERVLEEIGSPTGSGRQIVLSLEMFERDVQYVLDEYLDDLISEEHFLRSSRPWDDYEARYRPAVEAAKAADAPVVAANAPRRYVNRVSGEGPFALEALSAQARSYLPPLPYPGPSDEYRRQWDALMTQAMAAADSAATEAEPDEAGEEEAASPAPPRHGVEAVDTAGGEEAAAPEDRPYAMSPNVIYAQALWDAAMGHAITEALIRHVGGFVVHFAGSFHVERGTGIMERIADYRPGTRVVSVVMTKVDDIDAWSAEEHGSLGDFVVLTKKPTPEDSTASN